MNTNRLFFVIFFFAAVFAFAGEPPIMDWRFDAAPALGEEITDATGNVSGQLLPAGSGGDMVPQLLKDGVPCGTAWDCGDSDTIFAVKPDGDIQSLGDISATKGMAFAFWIQKDNKDKSALHRRVFGWESLFVDCSAGSDALGFITGGMPAGVDPAKFEQNRGVWNAVSAERVLDGEWHHVVFSIDFSKTDGNVVVYIDGEEAARNSVDFSKAPDFKPGKSFFIGGRLNGANRWTGAIGRFQAWNRALSADEVAKLNSEGK